MVATSSFTNQKRLFLLNKLDEIIKLWASGSGQGSFNFTVKNGTPNLQCGIQLEMEDVRVRVADPVHPYQHNPHHHQAVQRRRRGPARRSRDRQRAANHQAGLAAAAKFPGTGFAVGSAAKPSLPIPLRKGDVFPSKPPTTPQISLTPGSPVVSTVPTVTSSKASCSGSSGPTLLLANTSMLSPAMVKVRDEVVSDSEESEDEELTPITRQILAACARCLQPFTSSSGPGYCPQCDQCYHTECGREHREQCMAFHYS